MEPHRIALFESLIIPEPMSGCWLWIGLVNDKGYGKFKDSGRTRGAHRVAWELWRGPISQGLSVLHRCDTPSCMNPSHMRLGTHQDNMTDMKVKHRGRKARGEANSFAKLTRAKALAIRERYAAGDITQEALAHEFGIDQTTVSKVVLGVNWGWCHAS